MNTTLSISPIQVVKCIFISSCILTTTSLSANQNSVLEKFETAVSNWKTPAITTQLKPTEEPSTPAVALGETVALSTTSSEPSALILAIINTYGDVQVVKSDNLTGTLNHQFKAIAPVGQYSVFAFATTPAIPNHVLGMADGTTVHQLDIGMQSVDNLLSSIDSVSSTHKIAKAEEFQFLVDDTSLAMRGIRKKMRKLKKSKTQSPPANQPLITETNTVDKVVVQKPEPVSPETVEIQTTEATDTSTRNIAKEEEIVVAVLDTENSNTFAKAESNVQITEVEFVEVNATPVAPVMKSPAAPATESLSLDIKFTVNSDTLTQSGINALDSLGSALLDFQRSGELPTIMLEGHTDDSGSESYNLILSEKRADSARRYLLERFSLPENSVMSSGFGETAPKVPEQTREGRRINRRVELRVIN